MAKIRICNMMCYGFHGIYEYEREQGQKFFLDVELVTRNDKSLETDDVKDSVDAAVIYSEVTEAVENTRFTLLETLAAYVNKKLLAGNKHIGEVTTRIRKPTIPIAGSLDYIEFEVTTKG